MTAVMDDPTVAVALFRSAMYEALALAFAYPEPAACERLETLLADLEEFAPTLEAGYIEDIQRLRGLFASVTPEELAAQHNHLFEQSTVCSAFETEYEADPFAKGRQLADIAGFYQAFGMEVARSRPTMQDFLGTELEFMSLLSRKEAYAAARHWSHRRKVTVDAERMFLRDHLGRWDRAICKSIEQHVAQDHAATGAVYAEAARLCSRFVDEEVRRFQVRPLRLTQRMVGNTEPMDCPFAAPDEEPSIVETLGAESPELN